MEAILMLAFEPARTARPVRKTRLFVLRVAARDMRERELVDLPKLFDEGDVIVVNDAATLPASLFGQTARGASVEIRLLAPPNDTREADAVIFGAGDWRTPTEHRAPPPLLGAGDTLVFGTGLEAVVVSRTSDRRLRIRFERSRDDVIASLYRAGHPVQYAHIREPLPLWEVQNVYASEPWAVEMPSAGRPLDFGALDALRKRGVAIARLTHSAGLSSISDHALDASLPWVERYRIPEETAALVGSAKRVIAVGTSVVRALESHAATGKLSATTDLRIDSRHELRAVDGLLTGMHDATTSHADLLSAFVPPDLLNEASRWALARGFLGHELGDSCLILDR